MKIPKKKPSKEYIRLSFAIFRAKKAGQDISELLTQRKQLINQEKLPAKSREQINRDYYQRNKEALQEQAIINKEEKKEREEERREEEIKELAATLYEANSIKVLMSFKEYTALKTGKKLWLDFSWTLKDCAEGVGDIINIMRLRETADNLIRDYWQTARGKVKEGERWNILEPEQQHRLIKYWGREKFRREQGLAAKLEWQEDGGQIREREIARAKFHEERGKVNCECYSCAEKKKVRKEIINQRKKIMADYEREQKKSGEGGYAETIRADCGNCGEHKKVSVDSGWCRKCEHEQEE